MSFEMLFGIPSVVATLGMLVALATLGMAVVCAVKPDERRLSLMRPLTLATIFAALCSFAVGLANMLQALGASGEMTSVAWGNVAYGAAETLIPVVTAFGLLTVAWLLVAIGLRRA